MFKAFGGKCFYSGRDVKEDGFEIDHVVPKSKGGEDSIYNYVLVDKDINHKKSNKQDVETVTKILYIVSTAYAPKILKLLEDPPLIAKTHEASVQYFIDKGCSEEEAIEIKELYVDGEGYTVEKAWLWSTYGCLLSPASNIIEDIEDTNILRYLQEAFNDMSIEINAKLRL